MSIYREECQDIAKEVSVYIEVGTLVKDLMKNDDYEVRSVSRDDILLEHKPFFRAEKKDDLVVGYDELVHAFSKGRFFINKFSSFEEGGYKHDLDKMKRAVKDTIEKIKLEEERDTSAKLASKKTELEQQVERANEEKKKAIDEKEAIIQKRKSKIRAKLARREEEQAKERQRKIDEEERNKKIKILNLKKTSQQQRLRFITTKSN